MLMLEFDRFCDQMYDSPFIRTSDIEQVRSFQGSVGLLILPNNEQSVKVHCMLR